MRAPSSNEIRPDSLTLMDVIQVDITWALTAQSGADPKDQRQS